MPNALIQPYVQGVQAAVTCPLYRPDFARTARRRFLRDDIPELEYANSFYTVTGKYPCRGWVLVRRGDYNSINPYAINLSLNLHETAGGTQVTLHNLTVVQARCVSRGAAADPNALYLVELTDRQGVLWNRWFEFPTTSSYNVRAPAYPGQFYLQSLDAGHGNAPFTWDYMVRDLWNQMTALLGPYPGLPAVPAGTPEGFSFPGTSAWLALDHILNLLGYTVSADLTQDLGASQQPYGIVSGGLADAKFTALQAKYAGVLEDDYEWIDTGSGRVPMTVVVYFHRQNQYYGTEETVRSDSLQWSMNSFYSVTVNAPAQFQHAAGTHFLWDDFAVRYDTDGNPLAADVTMANTIAAERTTQYFARVYRGTAGYLKQVYTGLLPFVTGSLVDGVCYRQRQSPGRRLAWRTEIARTGDVAPWPEVVFGGPD